MTRPAAATRILHRLRRALTDMTRAHDVMWENLGRLDPDPSPYLHWEPTSFGWRLFGTLAPPDPSEARREGA